MLAVLQTSLQMSASDPFLPLATRGEPNLDDGPGRMLHASRVAIMATKSTGFHRARLKLARQMCRVALKDCETLLKRSEEMLRRGEQDR